MEYSVALAIWQGIVTVLCVMFAVRLIKLAKQIDMLFMAVHNSLRDIDDLRNYITEVRQVHQAARRFDGREGKGNHDSLKK